MGRINYGEEIVRNTKGIISPVKINGSEISDWKMYKLPMDRMPALASGEPYVYKNGSPEVAALGNKPVLYEGPFHLSDTGDTFIDMGLGKGHYFHQWHQYRSLLVRRPSANALHTGRMAEQRRE